jgi:hypothetical protein
MNLLESETALLDDIHALSSNLVGRVRRFVDDHQVRRIAATYAANAARRKVDLGFNAFALVSEIYHRENLHSDVMAAILDPQGAHGQGDRFLRLFLEFLRDKHQVALDLDDYRDASVEREPGRIDLLIRGAHGDRRKAIIVENKINGAPDMERQVAGYLKKVEDVWSLKCDAIIYLTLQQKGWPGTHGWDDDEKDRVNSLLKPICAFADAPDDLYYGWLGPCVATAADSSLEVTHVIRQYRQILLKLGQTAMNQPLMEAFYDLMKDPERHQTALSVTAMVNDLPAFRCQRLMEMFQRKASPFRKVYFYRQDLLVFENCGVENLKIHVETTQPGRTVVSFWNCIEEDQIETTPRKILTDLNLIDQFSCVRGWFNRDFSFPSGEKDLEDFLAGFLSRLQDHLKPSTPTD